MPGTSCWSPISSAGKVTGTIGVLFLEFQCYLQMVSDHSSLVAMLENWPHLGADYLSTAS